MPEPSITTSPPAPAAAATPVVWHSLALPRAARIAFTDLEQAGLVTRTGPGSYAAGGVLARLLARIDERIRTLAVTEFGATENCYPALIPAAVLHRAGHFDPSPQLPATAAYSLPPTISYHAYQQLAGREVPGEGTVLTACGRTLRFESHHHTLERLRDFTMREVVFLGSRRTVTELRRGLVKAICRVVDDLRLAGQVEVANDPFPGDAATERRAMIQRALKMKYELRMPVVEGRSVAVGSFNLHDTKFGKAFDITTPGGSPAYSGCIGIGLERIAYAFLCRHGIDPAAWPEF